MNVPRSETNLVGTLSVIGIPITEGRSERERMGGWEVGSFQVLQSFGSLNDRNRLG